MVGGAGVAEKAGKDPPLYGWALAYLPALFPRLRRLIWLEADTVVRADLQPLWHARRASNGRAVRVGQPSALLAASIGP